MTDPSIRERIWRLRSEARMRAYPVEDMRLVMGPGAEADLLTEVTSDMLMYPTDDYRTAQGATVFGLPCEVDGSLPLDQIKLVLELEG